jgi:hypothetical protein
MPLLNFRLSSFQFHLYCIKMQHLKNYCSQHFGSLQWNRVQISIAGTKLQTQLLKLHLHISETTFDHATQFFKINYISISVLLVLTRLSISHIPDSIRSSDTLYVNLISLCIFISKGRNCTIGWKYLNYCSEIIVLCEWTRFGLKGGQYISGNTCFTNYSQSDDMRLMIIYTRIRHNRVLGVTNIVGIELSITILDYQNENMKEQVLTTHLVCFKIFFAALQTWKAEREFSRKLTINNMEINRSKGYIYMINAMQCTFPEETESFLWQHLVHSPPPSFPAHNLLS